MTKKSKIDQLYVGSDWMSQANCLDEDREMFFEANTGEAKRLAKEICSRCVVVSDCLRTAIDGGEEHGIWGGMTPAERKRYVEKQRSVANRLRDQ